MSNVQIHAEKEAEAEVKRIMKQLQKDASEG